MKKNKAKSAIAILALHFMGLKPIKGNYEAAEFAATVLYERSCDEALRFARELSHDYRTWDSEWVERFQRARVKKYGRPRRAVVKRATVMD